MGTDAALVSGPSLSRLLQVRPMSRRRARSRSVGGLGDGECWRIEKSGRPSVRAPGSTSTWAPTMVRALPDWCDRPKTRQSVVWHRGLTVLAPARGDIVGASGGSLKRLQMAPPAPATVDSDSSSPVPLGLLSGRNGWFSAAKRGADPVVQGRQLGRMGELPPQQLVKLVLEQ